MSTSVAIVLLVGETDYDRLRGKPHDKGRMVRTASRRAVGALALLGGALTAVVFLVTDLLYRAPVAVPVAVGLFVLVVLTWFVLPLARRLRG